MSLPDVFPLEGGCDCKAVRYRMETRPLFVNCCHCRWCQRESGASFALNAMIEADRVELIAGEPEMVAEISDGAWGRWAPDAEALADVRALGNRSWLCVPLAARGDVIGCLSLQRRADRPPYDAAMLALASSCCGG